MTLPDTEALRRVAEAADNGPGPLSKLADREWQDLLEMDDRTSPEEYPDMALINRAEFGGAMSEAYLLARDTAANRISELEARVGVLEGEPRPRDAMIERSEEEWDAVQDAIATVYSFKEGHTLSASDIAALHLMDKYHREDEETATDAYHSGREEGLRAQGGDELVRLDKRVSDLIVEKSVESFMRKCAEARVLSLDGALAKRAYVMSEPHLSGWRVVIGFEKLTDAQDAHEIVARAALTPQEKDQGR